jgi:hypothetical protein
MKFQGAVITEQHQTFGILIVEPHVLNSTSACNESQIFGKRAFGNMPIILMAQDSHGIPTYYGRKDIVDFLANLDMSRIPWKEYELN